MGDPCVFFIKFPSAQKFCHVVLKIENQNVTPQNQTLKCRQLLFLCRDVIASPNLFDGTLLDVIMNVTYFKEKKILPYSQKLGLKIIHAGAAMLSIIQECITYTFQFKVSSHWNTIGQFLVKGPDVVRCSGKQDAVDVDVTVSHEQVTVTVRPQAIRNSPPTLEDFSICFQAIQNFHHLNQDSIEEFSIYQSWCHVLPSMKKGQLVKVSRTIPVQNVNDESSAPIKDHDTLKKYWKNHHGIKLPEAADGILYGSIYFKLIGPQLFTYPLCCLRTKDIQILPRCDGPAIIKDFMGVLTKKMDRVCGFKLMFSSKPCYVNSNLSEVSQIVPENFHNVSTQPINKPPPPPPKPPVATSVANISDSQKNDVILPSQKQLSKDNTVEPEVIPSSQVSQKEKQTAAVRNALKNLPTTADGKFIPSFVCKKKDVYVKNTTNCGRKIEAHLPRKKPNFIKHNATPSRVTKATGITASATLSKKYKTPRQNDVNMNDSGYCADETPIISHSAAHRTKTEKKLQPKKLCFDQLTDSASNRILDTAKLKKMKAKRHNHIPGSKTGQLVGNASVLQCPNDPHLRKGPQLSPLKVRNNHSFDKLFTKAGDHNQKGIENAKIDELCLTNSPVKKLKQRKFDHILSKTGYDKNSDGATATGHCPKPSHTPLNILKNHKFDQLFSKARQRLNNDDTVHTTSNSPMPILKNHRFDQLFSKAGQGVVTTSPMHCSTAAPLKILKNHKFDQFFSKAGDRQVCTDTNVTNHAQAPTNESGFLNGDKALSSHDDSGIGLNGTSPGRTLPNHRFDELFRSANTDFNNESGVFSTDGNASRFSDERLIFSNAECFDNADIILNATNISEAKSSLFANKHNCYANPERHASIQQSTSQNIPIQGTHEASKGSHLNTNDPFSEIKMKIARDIENHPSTGLSWGHAFNKTTAPDSCADQPKQKYNLHHVLKRVNSDFSQDLNVNVQQGQMITSGTTSFCQKEAPVKPTKRRLGVGSASSAGKRSRIQQHAYVEEMVMAGTLNKLNVPTLASWLNSNGVATTSRWKKDELIAKVKFQLMLTGNGLKGVDD